MGITERNFGIDTKLELGETYVYSAPAGSGKYELMGDIVEGL